MNDVRKVDTADAAARVAVDEAVLASLRGTFAVGGCIIDNGTGTVVKTMHNEVLRTHPDSDAGFLLHDPTAHGERQLVDWYFANRRPLHLPDPSQLTVVTSLDPCAMCAGALLTAGFNVGVSAIDTYAGINYDERCEFPTLPADVQRRAKETFGYYAVTAPCRRAHRGGTLTVFADQAIAADTLELSQLVFAGSVNNVRTSDNESGRAPADMRDPVHLPSDDPIRLALQTLYPDTLTTRSAHPRFPGPELLPHLTAVADQAANRGSARNAVALLDPFGNLLSCTGGAEARSPIRTAFLESTRDYAQLRWNLMNDSDRSVRDTAAATLTHAKYCTFVHLVAPDPSRAAGVMTFGAYGSTMEGAVPQAFPSSFQYIRTPAGVTDFDIASLAARMPPFYCQDVELAPMRVLNPELAAQGASTAPGRVGH
ncbi:cytosine deaminase [Catenuloplanes atrovinosus]|uniref:Cytosine deaminase n=2 Tax=Catenuloplanes atrovinosus TaxID=137266 RepID=A0AAE3YPV4_9ACTN|nr:cytosine deaminase [Catenuloplanes atrovinosus]